VRAILGANARRCNQLPFAFSQPMVLIVFIILTVLAVKKFRAAAAATAETPLTPGSTLA